MVVSDRLWDCADTTTVREVFEDVRHDREIASTTVVSMMDNLRRTESLSRERRVEVDRYWPSPTRDAYRPIPMRDAVAAGRPTDAVRACFPAQLTADASRTPRMLLRPVATRGQTP